MLDKYVWRVLFLALSATASLTNLTSPGPSCHDEVLDERTRLDNLRLESGRGSAVIFGNTAYERLDCLGFNPVLNLLSATIEIKLPFGFGGDLCTKGSWEYVRFWVNYGSGWTDIGLTAVNTHDILDSFDCRQSPTKPLYYTLSIKFEPDHKKCEAPVLPIVRATLSWNQIPSTNPADDPVWGNTLEETIQSLATNFIPATTLVYTRPDLNSSIDHVGIPDSVGEGHAESCPPDQEVFSISHAEDADVQPNASPNVEFEELTCLGLDWGRSSLVATVRVKQKRGYSANPCQKDHFEYVSFWADWNNNCSWVYLGTTRFNVHDFETAPSKGLVYTALWPVDVRQFSAPCNTTKIARVRAALAFNQVPPIPPALPPRGNYIETHVHLQPYDRGNHQTIPQIRLIGNVNIEQIQTAPSSPISGMTLPDAHIVGHGLADPSGVNRPCPFGGRIVVRGDPFVGHSYRLMVRPYPPPVTDPNYPGLPVVDFIEVDNLTPGASPRHPRIAPTTEGYFKYLEPLQNYEQVLSWWTPQQAGSWQIRLEMARVSSTGVYIHEGYSPWYMVRVNLKNPPPYAYLDIEGTECNDITINDEMFGKFVATSAYLDTWKFNVAPGGIPPPVTVAGANPLLPVPLPGRTWTLATSGARACGYVISLTVQDRTVVNSGVYPDRYWITETKGFCLRKTVV